MSAGEALGTARVYWQGPHASQRVCGRPLQSPLGKLHAEGLALLRAAGWQQLSPDDPRVPGFALTTRKGADFPASGGGLPAVRQFPQHCTAVLDDKCLLAECLQAAGCSHLAPRTWTDTDAFLQQHSLGNREGQQPVSNTAGQQHSSSCSGVMGPAGQLQPPHPRPGLWFLKHRHGVKGRAVHPYTSLPALLARLGSLGSTGSSQAASTCTTRESGGSSGEAGGSTDDKGGKRQEGRRGGGKTGGGSSRHQFLVQEGVALPLLLSDGRKFTMRAHVLIQLLPPRGPPQHRGGRQRQEQQKQQLCKPDGNQQEPDCGSAGWGASLAGTSGAPAGQAVEELAATEEEGQHQQLAAWVHEDVIVTPHAKPLHPQHQPAAAAAAAAEAGRSAGTAAQGAVVGGETDATAPATKAGAATSSAARGSMGAGVSDSAVHVSSRGSSHPRPFLLSQLGMGQGQGPAEAWIWPLLQAPNSCQHDSGHSGSQNQVSAACAGLQQHLWQQVCTISAAVVVAAARRGLVPRDADPQATLYHLFAFDFAVAEEETQAEAAPCCGTRQVAADVAGTPGACAAARAAWGGRAAGAGAGAVSGGAAGLEAAAGAASTPAMEAAMAAQEAPPAWRPQVLLLEANSYPAIASGTMAAVPRPVYTCLVGDLLGLVVLPGLQRAQAAAGAEEAVAEARLGAAGAVQEAGGNERLQEGGFHRVM